MQSIFLHLIWHVFFFLPDTHHAATLASKIFISHVYVPNFFEKSVKRVKQGSDRTHNDGSGASKTFH